jgi:hypothetical protein
LRRGGDWRDPPKLSGRQIEPHPAPKLFRGGILSLDSSILFPNLQALYVWSLVLGEPIAPVAELFAADNM